MLDDQEKIRLTELLQNAFSDLQIERDDPFLYESGNRVLVIKPVPISIHDKFLYDMLKLLLRHKLIFSNIDFLSAQNYTDKTMIEKLLTQVSMYSADAGYGSFIKDGMKFVARWGYVCKVQGSGDERKIVSVPKRQYRIAKKIIKTMCPDEFIKVLFLTFVRNYDIVKKNTLHFLQMFAPENTNTQTGTYSSTSKREVPQMPKFSTSPFPESVLKIFAEQSNLH